jgi:peptidoglycan/xylan/chitin deacetylase (PgdA/CDA1 family)
MLIEGVMLRALAKTCLASIYSWSGAGRLGRAESGQSPFIIGYHRVVEDFRRSARTSIPSMLISAATFEKHLDWLARRFSIVPLDDIGRKSRRPVAAVTFDDGYADCFHHAFPILKKKGIPAAVFVVTDLIGTRRPQVYDRLYSALARCLSSGSSPRAAIIAAVKQLGANSQELERIPAQCEDPLSVMTTVLTTFPQSVVRQMIDLLEADRALEPDAIDELAPLTWEMIEEMHRKGITIGSHTKTHALLTSEHPSRIKQELDESRQTIERRLQCRVQHFAYPDGRVNSSIVAAVKAAGYRFAYTICPWRDSQSPALTIPRTVLWEHAASNVFGRFSPAVMNCHAGGVFERKPCEHKHE